MAPGFLPRSSLKLVQALALVLDALVGYAYAGSLLAMCKSFLSARSFCRDFQFSFSTQVRTLFVRQAIYSGVTLHHPSMIGFGVDVEWYRKDISRLGKPVTDAEAQTWVLNTTSHNPAYQVFLKHWLTEKMPPTYREGLVFIDDSFIFASPEKNIP